MSAIREMYEWCWRKGYFLCWMLRRTRLVRWVFWRVSMAASVIDCKWVSWRLSKGIPARRRVDGWWWVGDYLYIHRETGMLWLWRCEADNGDAWFEVQGHDIWKTEMSDYGLDTEYSHGEYAMRHGTVIGPLPKDSDATPGDMLDKWEPALLKHGLLTYPIKRGGGI